MRLLTLSLVLAIGFLLVPISHGETKPSPPPELTSAIDKLPDLEECYEKDNWSGALAIFREIEELLLIPGLEGCSDDVTASLKALHESLTLQDKEKTEEEYINIQKCLFTYADSFAYMIPPVLIIIMKYLTVEATEALEKRDYDHLISELNEINELFEMASGILEEKGMHEESRRLFLGKLENTIKICNGKNHDQIELVFHDLKEAYNELLASFLKNN